MKNILLLHTSETHVARFNKIHQENNYAQSGLKLIHLVREDFLSDFPTNKVKVKEFFSQIASFLTTYDPHQQKIHNILITCSTIGKFSEYYPIINGAPVQRLDSFICRAAQSAIKPLDILYTVETTYDSTKQLFLDHGIQQSEMNMIFISKAWDAFLAGQYSLYNDLIRTQITQIYQNERTIILAQASMNSALNGLPTKIKSSILSAPELALNHYAHFDKSLTDPDLKSDSLAL